MKILIVEDHADSAQALARVLAKLGHEALIALTCADALVTAQEGQPDVALCDLDLPDCDGYDLMVTLRDQFGIRSAAVTGHGEPDTRLRCQNAGFDVVVKPLVIERIEALLKKFESYAEDDDSCKIRS